MPVVDLYNGIYQVLSNDLIVLSYLGIGEDASPLEKAEKIQKRSEPQNLSDNLPIIAFYAPPGRRLESNFAVYTTDFVFDIYTNDDVDTAQRLGDRIFKLFHGKIQPMNNVITFESQHVTSHESKSDLPNTYCFTVVINFSIQLLNEND